MSLTNYPKEYEPLFHAFCNILNNNYYHSLLKELQNKKYLSLLLQPPTKNKHVINKNYTEAFSLNYGNYGGKFNKIKIGKPIDALDLCCYCYFKKGIHRNVFQKLIRLIYTFYVHESNENAKIFMEFMDSYLFTIIEWFYMNTIGKCC
ncbi:hypothetical protein ABK040_011525 [Willaertia magna]